MAARHLRIRPTAWLAVVTAGLLAGGVCDARAAESPHAAYRDNVRPLLATRCFSCHGALTQEAGLRLDTTALMRAGGESGAALVPGDVAASLILARVRDPDPATRMPPEAEGEPFSAEEIAVLEGWIRAGAPAPADEKPEADPRDHWAFRPPVRPPVPAVKNAGWVRNPIDAFLARAHERAGIGPQPEALRHVLVRRLFIDLIGLPPQPEELAAIAADTSPDWYEKLVDKLLADPRHGERWARHWMDVWRYSDWWGLGDQHRNSAKHMWHFRDWIVESLNADVPYDEMVRQMLAADELYPEDPTKLRATGFLARNWFLFNRTPWLDDTVEHVGKGLLGLTLNCSKCHAHKYDPIRQEDYYRFRAFFEPLETRLDVVAGEADLGKDGTPRVFDAHLERPTYLFVRGEDTKPDTTRRILPGVPAVLAFSDIAIEPVLLPKVAYEPARFPWVIDAHIATAQRAVATADAARAKAAEEHAAAVAAVERSRRPLQPSTPAAATPAMASADGFADEFETLDAGRWELLGGRWKHEPGRLVQERSGQARSVVRLRTTPPRDFSAELTFTIISGGWRSVGIGFDAASPDPVTRQTEGELLAYASGVSGGPKLQVAVMTERGWQYPGAAAVPRPVTTGSSHALRVAVRDTLINVSFDDEFVMAWRTAMPRREGSLQAVCFDATAVIERFAVAPLGSDVTLREPVVVVAASPSMTPATLESAVAAERTAARELAVAEARVAAEQAAAVAIRRRGEAMRATWAAESDGTQEQAIRRRDAARAAVRSERELAVARARQKVVALEGTLVSAKPDGRDTLEKELAAARKAEAEAIEGAEAIERAEAIRKVPAITPDHETFTPLLGGIWTPTRFKGSGSDDPTVAFPATSTGRRSALARWITDPRNPLPARVAVNHIWMRHMGQPLVATVFEFGRKGNAPVHPELLDWLASELVAGSVADGSHGDRPQWSMKHLHRLICTSAAYRVGSSVKGAEAALRADPDNLLLWRRLPVRLESQVVRDAILTLAGTLDPTRGGPPVARAEQAASQRRSLYFWHSAIDSNPFLASFDDAAPRECYQRDQSIVPQQALALSNAAIVHDAAARIAARLMADGGDDAGFIDRSFSLVLNRAATDVERTMCLAALERWRGLEPPSTARSDPARVHLVWTLLNHNDFVTLR